MGLDVHLGRSIHLDGRRVRDLACAGVLAGGLLLVAFGLDSVVEFVAGAILLWHVPVQQRGGSDEQVERAEHLAHRLVEGTLVLLCVYLESHALREEAASSLTCGYTAQAVASTGTRAPRRLPPTTTQHRH